MPPAVRKEPIPLMGPGRVGDKGAAFAAMLRAAASTAMAILVLLIQFKSERDPVWSTSHLFSGNGGSKFWEKLIFLKSRTPPMLYAMSEPMTRYNGPDRHVAENKKVLRRQTIFEIRFQAAGSRTATMSRCRMSGQNCEGSGPISSNKQGLQKKLNPTLVCSRPWPAVLLGS